MIHDQAISIYRLHFFLAFLEVRLARRGKVISSGNPVDRVDNFLFRQPHDQHAGWSGSLPTKNDSSAAPPRVMRVF